MKFKYFGFIGLLLFALSSCGEKSSTTNCCDELETKNTTSKNLCINQSSPEMKDEDLSLKLDCENEDKFQHLHIDIKNNLGVLGKVTMNNNILINLDIRKKEVGACKKYKLVSGKYVASQPISGNRKVHFYELVINLNPNKESDNEVTAYTNTNISKGDIIDIFINSDDPNIQSEIPNKDKYKNISPNDIYQFIDEVKDSIIELEPFTKYDKQFCKSVVTGP